ncbi:MAG TPA: hypothetical protein VK138_05120 [Acidiferrobacterales bacterium]|nr:hypothetical protein [Acidiferrobacterales bacterium]
MHLKSALTGALLAAGCTGASLVAHAATSMLIGIAPSYSEGDYGAASTTKIDYVPVYLKYQADDLSLKLTVPYISVESAGAVVSGGTVIGKPGTGGRRTTATESGLGDIWLEGRYRLHGSGAAPDVIPYAKVKFGTASRGKGLGTGENDYEAGVGLEWAVGTKTFPFVDVGYRVLGQLPGVTLQDFATYDAGAMLKVDNKNFLTGMFAGHGSAVAGQAGAADLVVAWNHSLRPAAVLQAYFDKGLSDGSPNYAVGVGVETRF